MELVKKGYKKTEVGIIPNDWDNISIESAVVNSGLIRGPFGGALKKEFFVKDGFKVYEQKNAIYKSVELGDYFVDELKFKELKRFEICAGDFILSCSGTIGRIYLIPNYFHKGIINQALLIIRLDKNKINQRYFYYQFTSVPFQRKVIDDTQGGAMKNLIGMSEFRKVLIPLPPTLTEQKAIANALTDVDELITNLEKLIAKKKAIKQGAMQQLLTPPQKGGKRLDGFSGDWRKVKLGELGNTFGGLSGKTKSDFVNGMYPYITFLNVMNNTIIKRNEFGLVSIKNNENQNQTHLGDLFFNTSSETPEEVGMCAVLLEEIPNLYLNSFCFGFRLNNKHDINGLFLSYYFNSPIGRQHFLSLAQGATRYNLSKSNFNQIEFYLPNTEEQNAIARILNDMDIEIEANETKLKKALLLKQGMMQELLTGKTRLI